MRTILLLGCLGAACSTDRHFAPRENLNGVGPTGEPAAVYALAPPLQGEVRLWSDGAGRVTADGVDGTRIHLGFELENTAAVPLVLDPAALQLRSIKGETFNLESLPPMLLDGATTAAPGSTARCDFQFDPGAAVMPQAIAGFEVRWAVQLGDQRCTQVTPFAPYFRYYPAPFWDDWWCWDGPGWHHCH